MFLEIYLKGKKFLHILNSILDRINLFSSEGSIERLKFPVIHNSSGFGKSTVCGMFIDRCLNENYQKMSCAISITFNDQMDFEEFEIVEKGEEELLKKYENKLEDLQNNVNKELASKFDKFILHHFAFRVYAR